MSAGGASCGTKGGSPECTHHAHTMRVPCVYPGARQRMELRAVMHVGGEPLEALACFYSRLLREQGEQRTPLHKRAAAELAALQAAQRDDLTDLNLEQDSKRRVMASQQDTGKPPEDDGGFDRLQLVHQQQVRPRCALAAPLLRPRCALAAPSLRPRCALAVASLQPLCALFAPALRALSASPLLPCAWRAARAAQAARARRQDAAGAPPAGGGTAPPRLQPAAARVGGQAERAVPTHLTGSKTHLLCTYMYLCSSH